MQTEERWTLFLALGVYSPTSSGKAPPHALRLNSLIASLPSSFAKIRTLKEISSMLDQGTPAFSSPSVPGDLAATRVIRMTLCFCNQVLKLFVSPGRSTWPSAGGFLVGGEKSLSFSLFFCIK